MPDLIPGSVPTYSRREEKKGLRQRITEAFKGTPAQKPTDRIDDAYGVLKEVGGIRPIFNTRDVEQRRQEILEVMTELVNLEFAIRTAPDGSPTILQNQQKALLNTYKMTRLFQLFIVSSAPWARGLDNTALSTKTSLFIQQYEEIGDIPAFLPDLLAEAHMMISLCWSALDVTNTPGYLMQSTPLIQAVNPARISFQRDNKKTEGGQQSASNNDGKPEPRPESDKHEDV
jgi:hypothetical protein